MSRKIYADGQMQILKRLYHDDDCYAAKDRFNGEFGDTLDRLGEQGMDEYQLKKILLAAGFSSDKIEAALNWEK